MNKLFVLTGASGVGKSTLLDRLVKEGYCKAAVKYSERPRFNTVDDVFTVKNINDAQLQCDIIYTMYGNRYGFSSEKLRIQLQEGSLILITNDRLTIEKLKTIFRQQVVVIYIVSNIDKNLLRQIYIKRHGFPSIENEKDLLLKKIEKAEEMLLHDDWKNFIQCLEGLNNVIDEIVLQEEEFKLRLDSIKHQGEVYSLDLFTYDYTVLNLYVHDISLIYATKPAFEQLIKIVNKETGDDDE